MNLIEAIKTNRWFKRASEPNKSYMFTNLESEVMEFTREQLLADDWEIEQKPVTITKEQFDKACQSVLGRFASDHILVVCWLGLTKSERTIKAVLTDLAEELGL